MFELKEYTPEEYNADMQKLLQDKGLKEAVKVYLDKINDVATNLSYLSCREIQEYLCDIEHLITLSEEKKNG